MDSTLGTTEDPAEGASVEEAHGLLRAITNPMLGPLTKNAMGAANLLMLTFAVSLVRQGLGDRIGELNLPTMLQSMVDAVKVHDAARAAAEAEAETKH